MTELYKKLYITLFHRVEEVMEHINSEMLIKSAYDQLHTMEALTKLQAALQECEEIYVESLPNYELLGEET